MYYNGTSTVANGPGLTSVTTTSGVVALDATSNVTDVPTVSVESTDTASDTADAIYATCAGPSNAVTGYNTGTDPYSGIGVAGYSNTVGVSGSGDTTAGVSGSSSQGYGVEGTSVHWCGVKGYTGGDAVSAIWGDTSTPYAGVEGSCSNDTGYGVYGTGPFGVYGYNFDEGYSAAVGDTNNFGEAGVYGINRTNGSDSPGYGVYGTMPNAGGGYGVYGIATPQYASPFSDGAGVYGKSLGPGPGVAGESADTSGGAVVGNNTSGDAGAIGVYGFARGGYGIYGESNGGTAGAYGKNTDGDGVVGECGVDGRAVVGLGNHAYSWSGYFDGNVAIVGTLYKGGLSFLIDHPLDPTNRYLEHSGVESPDMKTFYDGVQVADANGEIVVQLPAYFDALNKDARYQLTAIGAPALGLHIKSEIAGGQFTIAGAGPGQKISWQVTASRKDPFAVANPVIAERDKPDSEKGTYRHPRAYGKPDSAGTDWERNTKIAARPVRAPNPKPPTAPTPMSRDRQKNPSVPVVKRRAPMRSR